MGTFADIPEHMRECVECYQDWAPEHYSESACQNCGKPIYRYLMDVYVEWRHFDHSVYCNTDRAKPTEAP